MSGVAAERSYPACKVRAQPRVPGCNSAGAAERSYPTTEAGAAARRSNPTSKKQWLHGCRRV